MTHYHLHLHNGVGLVKDDDGADFADLDEARARAVASVRSIISDEAAQGVIDLRGWIDIAEPDGTCLTSVRFADAVELRLPGTSG